MPKIGVCTWTYGERSLADILERVRRNEFDGVELFGNLEDYDPAQVTQLLRANDLQVFSLTPDHGSWPRPLHGHQGRDIAGLAGDLSPGVDRLDQEPVIPT